MWWRYLIKWLSGNDSRRLVLFIQEESSHKYSASSQNRNADKKRQEFISNGDMDKVAESVRRRIIIIQNSSIFDLKGISLSDPEDQKTLQLTTK